MTPRHTAKFWSLVQKGPDCWIWLASKTKKGGYGRFCEGKKVLRAHRVSYELAHGPFDQTLVVCHKCDRPDCVRPDHLFLGTPLDNTRDMIRKNRQNFGMRVFGSGHAMAKLNEAQVVQIRRLVVADPGLSYAAIGRRYGVTDTTISLIVHGQIWRHIPLHP